MINNLFATPVLVEQLENADYLNSTLLKEAAGNYGFELFDLDTPSIFALKNYIKNRIDDMAKQYGFRYSKITGRQNVIKPLESDTPHHHVGKSILVGVYYADVPPNSGDILLHDPRGPLPWENLNFNPDDPIATKSARCYHRVKPQNGLLLLFPGFLVHSVETNLSNQNRISIVLNAHY
jgi:uncharacterized protein (TIGR02466 family)